MKPLFRSSLRIFSFFIVVQLAVFAQTFRGGISGTVVDSSGATIAGAEVTLLGADTGLTRTVASTSAGEFLFQDLPLGKYSITIKNAGFQTEDIKDISVEAGKVFNLQAKLSVLPLRWRKFRVEASAAQIETASSAETSVILTKTMQDVPLNGRDFTQLLKLNPGVTASGSVNGTRTNSIDWQIDGADNNDQWHNSAAVNQGGVSGIAGTILPIDAIDEFSLQSSNNAEQGRNGGGVLNVVIKSGTNDLHGSLYYYNRNEALASHNWFVPPGPSTELRNSQPGGSLGGPIWKNHTFFFLTYEQQNYVAGQTAEGTTPSAAWVSQATSLVQQDGQQVNPLALRIVNYLWPANSLSGPATQNNYGSSANNISNSYNGIVKLDHIFNERNNIAIRYFGGTGAQTEYVASAMPYYFQTAPSRMHNFSFVYNTVINPHFVAQTTAGVNYFKQVFGDATSGFNMDAIGLETGVTNPNYFYAPNLTITGFDTAGETPPLGRIDTTGTINETFTYTHGSHQIRFGAEYRRARLDVFYESGVPGSFTFNGSQGPFSNCTADTWEISGACPANGQSPNASLDSLADFLTLKLGVDNARITSGNLQRNYWLNGGTMFAQDTWKVNSSLTLNYGLNWVYQSPINDYSYRISTFIPAGGGIVPLTKLGSLWPSDVKDFGPRFGFAYQPKFSNKLVVRGGYGIFYQVPNVNYLGNSNTSNGGASGILANPGGISPVYTLANSSPLQLTSGVPVFGSVTPQPPFGAFSVSQDFRTAYVQNTHVEVQYQVNQHAVLQVGYIGSLSHGLPVTLDINQIPIGSPDAQTSRLRIPRSQFPNLAAINQVESVGNAYYNGMTVSLNTVNYHGFNVKLNYTLGHARDDLSGARGIIPQNSYCLRCDYGNSDFDIRNSFVTYLGYALPSPSHAKMLLGGWQVNSLLSFYTGTPFTVGSGLNSSLTGENNDRAEVVGNPFQNVPANDASTQTYYWFNPAAFAKPTPGTYSNQARNSALLMVRQPSQRRTALCIFTKCLNSASAFHCN